MPRDMEADDAIFPPAGAVPRDGRSPDRAFVALGGSAYAALTITGKNIRNNTISTKDIRNNTVRTKDVKPDSLGGVAIKESALGTVPSAGITFGSARFAVVAGNGILARGRSTTLWRARPRAATR